MARKISPDVLLSFFVYGLGMGAYFFLDIYISATNEALIVSDWAFFKSYLFFSSAICVMGYDQLPLRDLAIIKSHLKRFLLQATAIGLALAILVGPILGKSDFLVLWGSAVILGVCSYFAGAARAQMKFFVAQLFTNGWRIILLILVLIGAINELGVGFTNFLAIVIFIVLTFFLIIKLVNYNNSKLRLSNSSVRHMSFSFFLGNMSLVAAIHGEQLLINIFNDTKASHLLFVHVAALTPIIIGMNGFIGFFLGPIIRKNQGFSVNDYRSLNYKLFILSIPLAIVSYVFGWIVITYGVDADLFDALIAVFILMICVARNIYIASSVVVAGFALEKYLRLSMLINWIILFFYIIGLCAILWITNGLVAARWIVVLTLIHWVMRCISGAFFSLKSVKSDGV